MNGASPPQEHLCLSGSPVCSGLFPCDACREVYGLLVVPPCLTAASLVTVAGIRDLLTHHGITDEAEDTIKGIALSADHVTAFKTAHHQAFREVQDRLRANAAAIQAQHPPTNGSLPKKEKAKPKLKRPGASQEVAAPHAPHIVEQAAEDTEQLRPGAEVK